MSLIATKEPGVFIMPELGKQINLTEWEEADIYDTAAIASGSTFQGGRIEFFTSPQGKSEADTNVRTPSKLPARHEVIVLKIGVYVPPTWGTATPPISDVSAFYHEGAIEVLKNRKAEVSKSHMLRFPSGYGLVAYGLNPGDGINIAPQSLGVASPAAIPPLLVPWQMTHGDDFEARIEFSASGAGAQFGSSAAPTFTSHTLADDLAVKLIMHGFIKSPATK